MKPIEEEFEDIADQALLEMSRLARVKASVEEYQAGLIKLIESAMTALHGSRGPATPDPQRECRWVENEYSLLTTGCGHMWHTEGAPDHWHHEFCEFCGGRIVPIRIIK